MDRCKEFTNCGEVAIPDEHLFVSDFQTLHPLLLSQKHLIFSNADIVPFPIQCLVFQPVHPMALAFQMPISYFTFLQLNLSDVRTRIPSLMLLIANKKPSWIGMVVEKAFNITKIGYIVADLEFQLILNRLADPEPASRP